MKNLHRLVLSLVALALVAGCATATTGTKIDNAKLSQIKKGVTTRAEVESLFGTPDSVSMMGDGRRMLMYLYMEHSTSNNLFIPEVGVFMGDKAKSRTQMLQVIVSKADIVEDYELSDQSTKTDINYLGGKVTTTKDAPGGAEKK